MLAAAGAAQRSELRRFLGVGALMATGNLALLAVLVDVLGWSVLTACCASFFALNTIAYLLNKVFTFRLARRMVASEWMSYQAIMLLSLGLNLLLMTVLVEGLEWHYLIASIVVSAFLALMNFAGQRDFTFARARSAKAFPEVAAQASCPAALLQVSAFYAAHGGGIEVVADQLARRLASAGVRVHWMASNPGEAPTDLPPGLTIDAAPTWDPLERRIGLPLPLWSPPALCRLWRSVGACDTVHVHDYIYLPTLLALVFARIRGKPVLLTQHIGEIVFASAAATRVLRSLNRTVGAWALGQVGQIGQVAFVARPVMAYFAPLVRYKQPPALVPNGVDHRRFHPGGERAEGGSEAAGVADAPASLPLLFVGRFVEKKGLPLLRQSATLPGVSWTYIGWGPMGPQGWSAEEQACVNVIGRLPAEQIPGHYRQASLLVLPSTGEGFPLVVQEALACGTPVLVSTEVLEAFPNTDTRCVYDVELRCADPAGALSEKLKALTSDPSALAAARPAAAALAQQWSWDATAGLYLGLHLQLAAGREASGASAASAPAGIKQSASRA